MSVFEELLEVARTAAMESVSDLEDVNLLDPEFSVADAVFHAVDELLPETVEPAWCAQILADRPELWTLDADGTNLADALRNAVRDLIIDEIDAIIAHDRPARPR